MNVTIVVAAHKPYRMPVDSMYLPLHVGHTNKKDIGWQGDDSGDNISAKNAHYCELTGLYWAWKNLDADAIGLAHYRRHFTVGDTGLREKVLGFCGFEEPSDKWGRILTRPVAEEFLEKAPVVVPPKRNYFVESVADQYAHAHHREDLIQVRSVIAERSPEYLSAFDGLMQGKSTHLFNMFIMRRAYFNNYCAWLFDILFALEKRLDISDYSQNDTRVFGFLGERLLDVWLETNKIDSIKTPVLFMERQNWLKKGSAFLLRKIRGEFFKAV